MTWRDIDIEVSSNSSPTRKGIVKIEGILFNFDDVRKISTIDYSDSDGVKKPKGLYVGAEYIDSDKNSWKIDIWLLTKDSERTEETILKIKLKLAPEYRERILDIKSRLFENPLYRKEVTSMDIYNAVIENEAHDLNQFITYMEKKGVKISI